jgi:hypothetical protein
MRNELVLPVLCGVLLLVLIINVGAILAFFRAKDEISAFGNAIRTARNPFHKQEEDLKELRDRIRKLEQGKNAEALDDRR